MPCYVIFFHFLFLVEIELQCRTRGDEIEVNWRQVGKFDDYPVSRYTLTSFENDSLGKAIPIKINQTRSNTEIFSIFLLYHRHDIFILMLDVRHYQTGYVVTASRPAECFALCVKNSSCIRYAFHENACHLISSINPARNLIKPHSLSSSSLVCNATSYRFSQRKNSQYRVKLEFIDTYGGQGQSSIHRCIGGLFFSSSHIFKNGPSCYVYIICRRRELDAQHGC